MHTVLHFLAINLAPTFYFCYEIGGLSARLHMYYDRFFCVQPLLMKGHLLIPDSGF